VLNTVKQLGQKAAFALYRNDYPKLIQYGAVARPNYAYIVYNAADLARRLGLKRISVLEFGVAGGRGLLNLEYHAKQVGALTGVEIEVYGFDTGEGLPPPLDYRDLPNVWQAAHFKMDQAALNAKLTTAKLVLGNVSTTVTDFAEKFSPAPIGAISFDLDYYSSTVDAFKIFDVPAEYRLPRIFNYFDDIYSSDLGHVGHGVGVPLAMAEFNAADSTRQLSQLTHLEFTYRPARKWHRQIYSFADFQHPQANQYIIDSDRQLAL
jgi:hypothetical protein